MWREIWDETVSKIYQDVLSKSSTMLFATRLFDCILSLEIEEPLFARQPKANPYAELKQTKKYL